MKRLHFNNQDVKGYTLLELLVVVAILATLSTIAWTSYNGFVAAIQNAINWYYGGP